MLKRILKYLGGSMLLLGIFFAPVSKAGGKVDPGYTKEEIQWLKDHPEITVLVNVSPAPLSIWDEQHGPPLDHSSPPPPIRPNEPLHRIKGFPGTPRGPHHPGTDIPLVRIKDNEQGQFRGMAADYLSEISEITGIRFRVALVSHDNFSAAHDALRRGDADLMPTMMADKSRPMDLALTQPYIRVPVVIVTRKDTPYIDDLKMLESMRVAGVHPIRPRLHHLGLNINLYDTGPEAGIAGVAAGKFDAFLCELTGISYIISNNPVANIKISGELPPPSELAMAVSPEMEGLIPILDKALAAIPKAAKDAIWQKWFSLQYEKKWVSSQWVKVALAGGILAIFACVFALFYIYRRFTRIKMAVEALDPHLLSLRIDHNIIITEATKAFCQATGFKNVDLVGRPLMTLGSPVQDSPDSYGHVWDTLKKGNSWKGEVKLVKKDGSILWAEAVMSPLRRKNDKTGGYTAIYHDITQRKHFEKLAVKDELTGLYNRRHFNEFVPTLLELAREENQVFALILMDVDHFKQYNDNYGHPAGDKVLVAIGRELRGIFQRNSDMVFRMGGEEFGAAIITAGPEDALAIGHQVLNRIRNLKITHEDHPLGVVTVSVGISTAGGETDGDLETLYQNADSALYQAKEGGRNRVVQLRAKETSEKK